VFKRGRGFAGTEELEFKFSGGGGWVYFQEKGEKERRD